MAVNMPAPVATTREMASLLESHGASNKKFVREGAARVWDARAPDLELPHHRRAVGHAPHPAGSNGTV